MDLGTVTTTSAPAVWAVGTVRDPAIQAVTATGSQETRSPYWRTFGSAPDTVRPPPAAAPRPATRTRTC